MTGRTDRNQVVRAKGTGEQIRDYLLTVDSDFPMNVWRAIKEESEANGYSFPTYTSFRNYWHRLKTLELIIEVELPGNAPDTATKIVGSTYERRYYKLNPQQLRNDAWLNPQPYYLRRLQLRREGEARI